MKLLRRCDLSRYTLITVWSVPERAQEPLWDPPPWHTMKFIWMWSPQLQIHLLFPLHILLVCCASPLAHISIALYFSIINFWHEVALNMVNTESNWYVKQGKHNESHVQMRLAPAAESDWNRIQNCAANFSRNFFTKSPWFTGSASTSPVPYDISSHSLMAEMTLKLSQWNQFSPSVNISSSLSAKSLVWWHVNMWGQPENKFWLLPWW